MQDLANGHLDVKALGEAANGDENTIVTTRTGNTYPSAERAINIMFQNGGLPAKPFQTKVEMQTDGASLVDGQLAMVYNETANNGLYVKTAGAWVKSSYDKADIKSPNFTGTPTVPNALRLSRDSTIANTKFVKDSIEYPTGNATNINLSGYSAAEYVVSDVQFERNYLSVYGTPSIEEVTIVIPSEPRKHVWIANLTNKKLLLKTDIQTNSIELTAGASMYITLGTAIATVMQSKASITSPKFLGDPTAPTPQSTARGQEIATARFVANLAQGVNVETVTDSSTEILNSSSKLVYLTGTITKDLTLVLKGAAISDNIAVTIVNATVGGYNLLIKGHGQSSEGTYVRIPNGQGTDIYTLSSVAYEVKKPINNGVPSTSLPYRYKGKFKKGSSYTAGDVIEHGSGIYQATQNVGVVASPKANPAFNKLSDNPTAGANRELTVLSNTYEDIIYTDYVPTYMSRSGLVMFNNSTSSLRISRDYGKNWEVTPIFAPSTGHWLRWTRELESGELLVCTSQTDGDNPHKTIIHKSKGWDEDAGTVTQWDVVLQFQKKDVYIAAWGFSQHGKIILLAEYGGKNYVASGGVQDAYPRYCYLSKDNGETWSTVFDLADYTDGVGVHLHGVCFDEYWNRIWISHGDGSTGKNGLYYSDDLGKTWVSALQTQNQGSNFPQSVGIVALPTCILFSSDSYPNGVQRIDRAQGRIPYKGYYEVESAYRIEPQQELLNHILSTPYKAHWLPNAPYIWTWAAESRAGNTGCVLSWNGWDFHTVWKSDTDFDPSRGAKQVIGITPENTLIISGDKNDNGEVKKWKRTIKVSFD